MTAQCTRVRILDAAEDLFAQHGVAGTSLRALTAEAGVNLAAVHYHFGSKDALLDAVVERRAEPINAQRAALLAETLASGDRPRPDCERDRVEAILVAFYLPVLDGVRDLREGKSGLARLLASIDALPTDSIEALLHRHFGDVSARFIDALAAALPGLPREQVADRFRFAAAVVTRQLSGHFDLDIVPNHPPCRSDDESRLRHAIAFIVAGFVAPAVPASTRVDGARTLGGVADASSTSCAHVATGAVRKAASS